jgi:hypothetical protein
MRAKVPSVLDELPVTAPMPVPCVMRFTLRNDHVVFAVDPTETPPQPVAFTWPDDSGDENTVTVACLRGDETSVAQTLNGVQAWARGHNLLSPRGSVPLACLELALMELLRWKSSDEPQTVPSWCSLYLSHGSGPWPPEIVATRPNGGIIGDALSGFSFWVPAWWDTRESEGSYRVRVTTEFTRALEERIRTKKREHRAAGHPLKRELRHFEWFVRWQIEDWNAAKIHRTYFPGKPTKKLQYAAIRKGLNDTAALLGVLRRRGRPGRPKSIT